MIPRILIAGHIVKDLTPDGWQAGGGALYAAAQAGRMGCPVTVVTACSVDIRPAELLSEVDWQVLSERGEISFQNRYESHGRTQKVTSTALPLADADLASAAQSAQVALLTPVFHDVSPASARFLSREGLFVGLAAQGWLRREQDGTVLPGRFETVPAWLAGDVVFVSEEDVETPEAVAEWSAAGRIVVLTRGSAGVTVWQNGVRRDFAVLQAQEVDPTGAGDVFAAAFLVKHYETMEIDVAARFAMAAAALSVEAVGVNGIADRRAIEAKLEAERVMA